MNVGAALRQTIGFLTLLVAHFSVRPLLGGPVPIDFLAIGVLLAAARLRPGTAAVLGLAAGLVADALAPGAFGAWALSLSIVAFAASWLRAVFFADHLSLTAMYVAGGKWIADALYLLLSGALLRDQGAALWQLGVWSPLAALLTAAVAVVLLLIVRPLVPTGTRSTASGRLMR